MRGGHGLSPRPAVTALRLREPEQVSRRLQGSGPSGLPPGVAVATKSHDASTALNAVPCAQQALGKHRPPEY